MSNSAEKFAPILKNAEKRNCIYFTGDHIDPTKTNKLNEQTLRAEINKLVPDIDYEGILVLDWEDSLYNVIKFDTAIDTKGYEEAIDEFLKVLRFARSVRPKAKWAFWDIPISIFWVDLNKQWKARYNKLDRLLKEVDILMPHLYDYYPTGVRSGREDSAYIEQILHYTLLKAYKFNKPVLPFIWHRYSDAIEETGLKKIDPKEFDRDMQLISSINYKGKKIDGIIWWQEDLYFLNIKAKNIMDELSNEDLNVYRDKVLFEYYNIAIKYFEDKD